MTALTQRCAALLRGVSARIEDVRRGVQAIGTAAESIAGAACAAGRPVRREDLAVLRALAAAVLREHASLAAGAGLVLAPGVVAGAPRCLAWWWADQQARIVPLHVDTDPSSAEYYDYTTTAWYREPERTGQPAVAGPYVDFICTREYTFTLAVPVRCAGRFVGVAGADMLAAQVERLVLPELARIGQAAVLTTGQGRVIASNTASILPGSAVPAGAARAAGPCAAHGSGLLPWTILCLPGHQVPPARMARPRGT